MGVSVGLSRSRLKRLDQVMRGYVDRGEVAGLVALVSRGDDVHVETIGAQDLEAGTPMRQDTLFRIASMTKPIAAAAAMILVEEARLRLDDPIDRLLPELADRNVLRGIDALLDDTVPANRPITLRDLLTMRAGIGAVMAPPGTYPIQAAMAEAGVAPGVTPPALSPDEVARRYGSLPLIHQPGERWMYHNGFDILGVLIARAAGMPLEDLLRQRLFQPLGMKDTAFDVPGPDRRRLATCYRADTGGLVACERESARLCPSAGTGLASTAGDYLAFGRMMLRCGRHGSERVLARPTVELMTTDHITAEQKAASPFFPGFWDSRGWGFGVGITTRRSGVAEVPGRYGWDGGLGTTWRSDPKEDLVAILLIQRLMTAPDSTDINEDFLTLAYQAIGD
jgi:CubicO group peptidase (beta-lactamase class C family)